MSKVRARHENCFVYGCKNPHISLHKLPPADALRKQWLDFVCNGNDSSSLPKNVLVCANHFTRDCFSNFGQYIGGFASKLRLKEGSLPTIRNSISNEPGDIKPATFQLAERRHVACQTEPETRSVGTQLSFKTLQPHFRSEGVQATVAVSNIGVGTSTVTSVHMPSSPIQRPSKRPRLDLEEEDEDEDPFEGSASLAASQELDDTYDPTDSSTVLTESMDMTAGESCPTHKIKKYIVYETCLMELFQACPVCQLACDVKTQKIGTFLLVEQLCPKCEFSRQWKSQPVLGSTPAGNIHLSAAVYLSGASFFTLEKIFKAMELQLFQYDIFRRHARMYIEPAVVNKWKTTQDVMLNQLSEEEKVTVRANSLGHCAKFGSHTMMDLKTNTVIDIQLVQSNKEKQGLRRSLALLKASGVTLDSIVTDRHPQIQRFLRENNIPQFYDVLHIEKGISKKLDKISEMSDCEQLQKWIPSIRNHIYWTAATSTTGPERVAKWTSVLNHVQDIHTHEDPIFPKCLHPLRITRDRSKWLEAGTPVFDKMKKVMTNRKILQDIAKLSPHHQTSSSEAFHSVILRFAPKNVVFPFLGMLCRLYLAGLYYNENANRQQAITAAGDPLFKVHFPKDRDEKCSAQPVKAEPTFRFVDDLMDLIFENVFVDPEQYMEDLVKIPIPADPFAQYERPDKEEVIASYVSRFNEEAVRTQHMSPESEGTTTLTLRPRKPQHPLTKD